MGAAFHERDTRVTAKCNVCFKGVNAAGGTRRFDIRRQKAQRDSACGDRRNSERSQKAAESATRTERSKCQGEAASSERQSREARGRRQRPNRMASTRRQAANGKQRLTELGDRQRTAGNERHVTQREADGRRRACATTPRSSESSIASKQGRRDRKWRNGALLQGQLSRKGEWLTVRKTFCLIGGNIDFMAKLHPAKNRPHSRHFWHRNTIPMQ